MILDYGVFFGYKFTSNTRYGECGWNMGRISPNMEPLLNSTIGKESGMLYTYVTFCVISMR